LALFLRLVSYLGSFRLWIGGEIVFSFDLTTLITIASNLFSSLMPIVAVVGGISLGIGLVTYVLRTIRNIL
jgi:hypothetical protein